MAYVLLFVTLLHLITLAMLFIATMEKSWWVWDGMENSDLWYNCRFDNFTGTWLCASSKETDWLQAVQVLMVLSVAFSSVSFLVFLGQLFTMSKGGLFYFTGLCQLFAGLMAFSAALIYTLHNKEILQDPRELTSGHFGYCFILAWVCVPILVELIEICRLVAQNKLSERKHREALPAAQFCLRCSIDVHGPSNVQLVPAYLLLAEANMGLGDLALVTELLSQAEWAVLKSPDCGYAVHHQLQRSLGRLHMATGKLEAALFNFANDIYYASEEYGLDSTVTCGGYFLMADVFAKQGKTMIARSLYFQVADSWHCHLTKLFKTHLQNVPNSKMLLEASYVEVDELLRTMLEFEQNDPRKNSLQIALVAHCLAMLWFLGGDSAKALQFGNTALQAIQLIPNHDLTEPIQGLLQLVCGQQTDPHPGSE
ncbi:Zinc finger MYND domain-containing protein 12 [Channa argus]|uniref:Zinc finger MYND domain-containing protein 12 n=1 Tax=Channa argus TaxID=215402 RepID=A0A6G1Q2I0_CHAAH|nr:Zinc finger MYND domain-containing protein 12 [Channa argus]